ncbi:MAG: sulfite exporter TauE/SafE family protein [Pseudomonadota bacterium]|nr:sulfite exporter TauE/SafE family protein [Pseudomonadota bacterium]
MEFGLDPYSLGVISLGLAIGAFVKGLTGMGLPLVAIPFMAGFLGAEHAIVVMQIPGLVSNAWLVWSHRSEGRRTPVRYDMILPAIVMTVIGVWFLDTASDNVTILLLAGAVAFFLLLLLLNPSFRLDGRMGRIGTPIASMIGGFTQGASGVSGPLFSTLIFAFRLKKEAYVYYNGLLFGLFNAVQIAVMLLFGMFTLQRFAEGCVALIPLFIFQFLGMRLMGSVSPKVFNGAVVAVIVLMEIKLVWEGFSG